MFPGGRSSQKMPGGNSAYPSTYYRDVAAVSNPAWFGNNPTPVPPPVQYPSRESGRDSRDETGRNSRAESGRDLLAESYERMRNEMRSLQGVSTSKYGSASPAPHPPAPHPPAMEEEKVNPLTQLLENKDVSLSSLLEAAMDPNIGSSKRKEDPVMKKTILDKCERKITQLYRLRISGRGMFFPMTQPNIVKFDGVSKLTYNHPRIEFNMVPEETVWMCPDIVTETKKEEPPIKNEDESEESKTKDTEEGYADKEEKDRNVSNPLDKIEVLIQRPREPPSNLIQQQQQQQQLLLRNMLSKPPPPNVSYPTVSQYRATIPPMMSVDNPYSVPPPVIPNTGQLPLILAEMEKERRRKEIEIEWDRLMQDKERKDKKRKKKKRSRSRSSSSGRSESRRSKSRRSRSRQRSRSRGRSSHRRSHSRNRNRDRSREGRYRRRSRSLSISPSPSRRRSRSPLRIIDRRLRLSPSQRERRSPPFHRSLQHADPFTSLQIPSLMSLPPRYRSSEEYPPSGPDPIHPPRYRPREEYPPSGPGPIRPYSDALPRPREEYPPHGDPMHPYNDAFRGPPDPTAQLGPPGFDSYYNPPPPGMDGYGPQYDPGMIRPQGPMGPMGPGPHGPHPMGPMGPGPMGPGPHGPHPWGWGNPNMRPPAPEGPRGPWPGPDRSMYRFGPPMHMGPMGPTGPMPREALRPKRTRKAPIPVGPTEKGRTNLIDVKESKATAKTTVKKPVVVVDITDDNDKTPAGSAKIDNKNVGAPKNESEPDKLKPADDEKPTPDEKLIANKAKVISNIIPPGVSPDRETETRYPNVESEFTRPMRAAFRKMLEPLEKVLDKIRLYQRDSFDFKTLIKTLESGKIEFMGVHTLHDGLLCKLEINRKHPDKFFKIVVPRTHVGRLLRQIHSTYHDYSIGRIQRLIEDVFNDPHEFSLSRIVGAIKQCKECIEAEEKERKNLRKEEILIIGSPVPDRKNTDEPLSGAEDGIIDPMVKPRRDHHRQKSPGREDKDKRRRKDDRSRRPSDAEKEGNSRRDSEKSRSGKPQGDQGEDKNKSLRKSPINEGPDTYSKFEDLGVSRKMDDTKTSPGRGSSKPNDGVEQKGRDAAKKGVPEIAKNGKKVPVSAGTGKVASKVQVSTGKGAKTDEKKEAVPLNQKKPISLDKSVPKATVNKKESGNSNQVKSTGKTDPKPGPQPKPQQKPVVNPDDFKERVRSVQMGVTPLNDHISDLEGLGKKSSDPALLLKAGMLCRRLPSPTGKGKPEVKIVVNPACLKQMVEIVHTMSALHAPLQKTVTVFNKHFVPIAGLEKVVYEVLNCCAKCSSDVKK